MPFWLAKVKICFDTSFLLFRNVLTIHICGSQTSRFIYQAIVHSSSVTAKWAGVEAFDPPPHFAWWEVHFAIMKTVFLQNSIKQNINHKSERSSHGVPICAYCCTGKKKNESLKLLSLFLDFFSGRAHTFLGRFCFWGVSSFRGASVPLVWAPSIRAVWPCVGAGALPQVLKTFSARNNSFKTKTSLSFSLEM